MRRFIPLFAAIVLAVVASTSVKAEPYLGFVTVTGDLAGDDMGPDARIQGEALKYSGATCVRASYDEAKYFPLNGRPGIGYAWGGMSSSDIQYFNTYGYYNFIFENEPDGTAGTNPNWAVDYMNRLKATYPTFKSVNTGNQVIGGNLAGQNYNPLYDNGLKSNSEMIGYHCYSNDPTTGIQIDAVKSVHDIMVNRGDGSKKMFLGEGWGPMRELPGQRRLFPDAEITSAEIHMLRDFVVNGYWNIVTWKSNYDPNWVYGVLFFTLSDNWGGKQWAARAVPHYDGSGNVLYYTVDGYNVGLDIFPHFYNGGLIDIYGNAKDNLMDIFPGKGLALSNSGFEYYDRSSNENLASEWTARTNPASAPAYGLDASIRHGGKRSQRLTLAAPGQEYIQQDSVKSTVTPGLTYRATAWVKTYGVVKGTSRGAALKLEFLNSSGAVVGTAAWSNGLDGTSDWTKLGVNSTAPTGAVRLRVTCDLSAASGRAWFDDTCTWEIEAVFTATLRGYVLDSRRNPVQEATVRTSTGGYSTTTNAQGYFSISNVEPGVYDVTAVKTGYSSRTVKAQLALPNKSRVLGFALPKDTSTLATGVTVEDPSVGGVLKVAWTNPSATFNHLHIYRSTDPAQLGDLVYDNVTSGPIWDSGLSDGTRYCYTIRSVVNGVERTNKDNYYGVATAGTVSNTYSYYPGAEWRYWTASYGQTFTATCTGSISSASCTPGFGGGGGVDLTFTIHENGPGGAQVGPSRTKRGAGDTECTATWNSGEIHVQAGRTYYLKVKGSGGFAAYSGGNVYSNGCFYVDDSAVTGSDMWSTITIAESKPVVITDVAVTESPAGTLIFTWKTSAPSTSQVEYGVTESYGTRSTIDEAATTDHSIVIRGLKPDTTYHFRVKSTRSGLPNALSLDYTVTTLPAQTVDSPAAAKTQDNGVYLSVPGIVTAGFDGFFYIEDASRVSGIRVEKANYKVTPGIAVRVTGILKTNAGGERYIEASLVSPGT